MSRHLLAPQAAEGPVVGRRPLDILIMTSEAPPITSGVSTCVDRLATGLIARDHRVRVLSCAQIRRIALGEWRLSSFVAHWPWIARQLRHVDVVNVHGPVPTMSDVFLCLSGWLPPHARPAVVYTHHAPIDIPEASRMSVRYNKLHQALAFRADRIVASSPHYARQHRSRYGPLVRAIPWGADPRTSAPAQVLRPDGELNVLFVGQMRPYKGVETLLAAAEGQPWLNLTLVGAGTELARYRGLTERRGLANVRFAGRLSDAELHYQYGISDAVVLPSVTRAEAFGLVLVEGMAAGCVPVASDLPGVRDISRPDRPGGAARGPRRAAGGPARAGRGPGQAGAPAGRVQARRGGPHLGPVRRRLRGSPARCRPQPLCPAARAQGLARAGRAQPADLGAGRGPAERLAVGLAAGTRGPDPYP